MAKTLVIVPHEDDELSVAGQLLVSLSKSKVNESYVVFMTNGDIQPFIGGVRIKEAINSLSVLGIEESHIFFLGYGNEWNSNKHIYNCDKSQKIISQGGFERTYSILEHPEYCYLKYGVHHLYTRENIKNDLLGLLYDLSPEFIICVDYDSHVDHRATSLLFEECMGEILKSKVGYMPIIWKKFGYLGAWNGPKDYYKHEVTRNPYANEKTDNPMFKWSERIRVQVDDSCKTWLLRDNIIYKAALCHKTQNAWLNVQRLCNEDVVYWKRNTNNYMLRAHISAETGNYGCLNDFIVTNSADIGKKKFITDDMTLWHPTDIARSATFEFDNPVHATRIVFYESPLPEDHIKNILVRINDKYAFATGELNCGGRASVYCLEYNDIRKIEIKIEDWEGDFPGLSEVELLGEMEEECLPEGIRYYEESDSKELLQGSILVIIEYWLLRLKAFWTTALFPNHYLMAKKYPIIQRKRMLLPVYWIIDWLMR